MNTGMFFILIFLYLGLTAFGVGIMHLFKQKKMRLWKQLAVGFCIGQGCYTLLLWLGGMIGGFTILVWFIPVASMLYLAWKAYHNRLWRGNSWRVLGGNLLKQKGIYFTMISVLIVGGLAVCLFQKYALIAAAYPIEDVPGMGNWAYKSKIIFQHQGVPQNYISEYSTQYGKFSYPLGFPIISAALYTMAGSVEEVLVRVNTAVLLTLAFIVIASQVMDRWSWLGFIGIFGLLGFFLGKPAYEVLESFYAEPLMLYCVAVSLLCLIDEQWILSLLCAGCAAWTKQEGIVFFGLLAMCMGIIHWRQIKLVALYSGAVGFLFVILWRIYLWKHQVSDSDFSLASSDDMKMQAAWEKVYQLGVEQGFHYSSAAYLLPIILVSSIVLKESAMFICSIIAVGMIAIFVFSMRYSNVRLDWHLWSAERYLMLSTVCILMGVASLTWKKHPTPLTDHETQ